MWNGTHWHNSKGGGWRYASWDSRDAADGQHWNSTPPELEWRTCVVERLLGAIVRKEASRQVVAAASVALLRTVLNETGTAAKMLLEHEEVVAVATKHFGEGAGISTVCSSVKALKYQDCTHWALRFCTAPSNS